MRKKNKNGNNNKKNKTNRDVEKPSGFILPDQIKQKILSVLMILLAVITGLSFFDLAGMAGQWFLRGSTFFLGKVIFIFPLLLVLSGMVFWEGLIIFKKKWWLAILAIFIFISSLSGILGCLKPDLRLGGTIGYLISWPLLRLFDFWVSLLIFGGISTIAGLIFFYPFYRHKRKKEEIKEKEEKGENEEKEEKEEKVSFIRREIFPKFKVKEIAFRKLSFPSEKIEGSEKKEIVPDLKLKQIPLSKIEKEYQKPPIDLLEEEKKSPKPGDLKINAAIIKRTLQNFSIPVEMGQVNVGPTVTQYTLKPAEGVKISKITALSNDLSLALASHPIRIEAPIPGKSLVGIEVPNQVRAPVRLKELIQDANFQNSPSRLAFVLGKDVSGDSTFADLARMPHLLVAGSTGTGKTVFLNSLIISLLYRNSPDILKFVLIDPKRVEFPIYAGIPHLLVPAICNNGKAVNVLKWLIEEMERRFDVFSKSKAKDINTYNELVFNGMAEPIPYIVLVIDELADLMAAKGREVEALIVRLAQMSRAVGIHLVVATQRPSVEVITGLIKANITSRIAFQVASQVDSRTIFDMAGAEKLLGRGDMLFTSAEVSKPKRVQAPLVTEKEIKKVVKFIRSEFDSIEIGGEELAESLHKRLEEEPETGFDIFSRGEDPLYESARQVVVEAGRASASLLQRRLQIGYARAARLIDMLEERGIIGPADGAKPREIYKNENTNNGNGEENKNEGEDGSNKEDYKEYNEF